MCDFAENIPSIYEDIPSFSNLILKTKLKLKLKIDRLFAIQ